jgi:nicotinamide mononucleotide transporter
LTEFFKVVQLAAGTMSLWETVAVLLAIAYLLLAIRQNPLCWPAAIVSAAIYIVLMFRAELYMESALQVFYIGMAFYGWWHWSEGRPDGAPLPVVDWPLVFNVPPLLLIALLSGCSGWLLENYSSAAYPYLDSATTWAAMVTTWMVARKALQNWHYWFVIDSVSIYLYTQRGLYLTALLFTGYLLLIVVGYRTWRRSLQAQYA